MKTMIIWFASGWIIVVSAIIINILAGLLKIATWYHLIEILSKEGLVGLKHISVISYLFLFLIYPLLLGIIAYYSFHMLQSF